MPNHKQDSLVDALNKSEVVRAACVAGAVAFARNGKGGKPADAQPLADPKVGDPAIVHGHGGWRLGVVVEVGPKRARVAYTTPGAIKEAEKHRQWQAAKNPEADQAGYAKQAGKDWDFYAQQAAGTSDVCRMYPASRDENMAQGKAFLVKNPIRDEYAARKGEEARQRAERELAESKLPPAPLITAKPLPRAEVYEAKAVASVDFLLAAEKVAEDLA
jgi:hypothetical protein